MSALIPSHSSANRVVETDLAVKYSQTRVYGSWSYVLPGGSGTYAQAWQYTRTATKTYKYVGMDYAGATACATAMRTKYQRSVIISQWEPNQSISEFVDASGGSVPMADVAVQMVTGGMWEVIVNVSETDSRMRITAVASVESLFSAENSRDYDTSTEA